MTVVSIRIDEKVKKTLERAGVNISKEVKKYLEELAWKIELRESIKEFSKILENVPPAEEGFSAKSVREDRESH
ncbi:MAG TPA: VapB-type antitoxin [Nitrososphaeria archaeon]|nr:MAG: VapB-type antitoxin [Nitrososphaerota archaeon]HDD42743.1 VapB-type antitoxin [Nitrososphaeria archaeon]